MISQTGRYALQILGYLAMHRGEMIPGEAIAEATGVPANYLSKILNQLRKAEIVDSRKGWGGGFRLKDEAAGRPIRDVLVAIDGLQSTNQSSCVFGLGDCSLSSPCPLHSHWDRIRGAYEEMLSTTRVGDLATG